jgi:polysaccharide transporter, PST family
MITSFLIEHSPSFIKTKIENNQGLRKIIGNINWLMAEKVIYVVLTFLIGVLVVRYLGPQRFGRYSYVASFIGLLLPLATLGLDSVVIRELVNKKDKKNEILGNTFILRLIGSGLLLVTSVLASLILSRANPIITVFIVILAVGHIFQSLDTIDLWFQSQVESKYSALSRFFAFIITSLLQVLLIIVKGPLIGFIWISSIHLILNAVFYIYFYQKQNGGILNWKLNLNFAGDLISSSWPLIVSGFAIAIYMKIDQIIINSVLGETQLGYYSTAVKLSQAGYFLPTIIAGSVYPAIINAKRKSKTLYDKRLKLLYGSFLWSSILISGFISLFSRPIILLIFGNDFLPAANALSIHIWAFVFVSLGVASGKQLLTEDKTLYSLLRTIIGAIASIVSNLLLIPRFGIAGAAISAVIAQSFSAFLTLYLFKPTRNIFKRNIKAFDVFKLIKLLTN